MKFSGSIVLVYNCSHKHKNVVLTCLYSTTLTYFAVE